MRESDENSSVRYFRAANRYFCQDGKWWFCTRESEEGPFNSRGEAEAALERYLNSLEMLQKMQIADKVDKEPPEDRGDVTIWDRQIDAI